MVLRYKDEILTATMIVLGSDVLIFWHDNGKIINFFEQFEKYYQELIDEGVIR